MNKPIGRSEPPPDGARANRQRLAPVERPAILGEIDKKAADVRMNMERLRELRLAKEAQEVRREILTGSQPAKPNRKSDSDRPPDWWPFSFLCGPKPPPITGSRLAPNSYSLYLQIFR